MIARYRHVRIPNLGIWFLAVVGEGKP